MKRMTVEDMGTEVQGVRFRGDKNKRPEPETFRIVFPGGEVEVVRTTDDEYWAHVLVTESGRLANARLDLRDKATSEADVGDFNNPSLYHLAVRIAPVTPQGESA